MNLLITFLYILFVLAAIVLVTAVLLQEGKGGGLGDAFGGAGQQTFGVGASGINKFTGAVATVFLVSALTIHLLNRQGSQSSVVDDSGSVMDTLAPESGAPPAAPATPPTNGQ